VGEACLDYSAMLWQQRIVLTNIPVGTARVVFSGRDFGHFLVHPLVVNAAARAVQVRAQPVGLSSAAARSSQDTQQWQTMCWKNGSTLQTCWCHC
jgi:hypothetical protein